jgi:hypothetical protein
MNFEEKQKNLSLYGLEIDDRAYQLAYFSVLMKARAYNRRILNSNLSDSLDKCLTNDFVKLCIYFFYFSEKKYLPYGLFVY